MEMGCISIRNSILHRNISWIILKQNKTMNKGHSTTETFIRFIVTLVIGVIAIICLIKILDYGIVGVEEQYCYKLQAQAEQYKNFTLSKR